MNDQVVFRRLIDGVPEETEGVLDLGCGTGCLGTFVLRETTLQYFGVDQSRAMIAAARDAMPHSSRVVLLEGDFTSASFGRRFDGWTVVLKNVLHLLDDIPSVVGAMRSRLGDIGTIEVVETEGLDGAATDRSRSLFEGLGLTQKRHWFVQGDVRLLLERSGLRILEEETLVQEIDAATWLGSLPISGADQAIGLRIVQDWNESDPRSRPARRTAQGAPRLSRRQTMIKGRLG